MGDLNYPLVSDLKREISQKYGVLSEEGVALRGLFIIDKEVRAMPLRSPPLAHMFRPSCRLQGCFMLRWAHICRACRMAANSCTGNVVLPPAVHYC